MGGTLVSDCAIGVVDVLGMSELLRRHSLRKIAELALVPLSQAYYRQSIPTEQLSRNLIAELGFKKATAMHHFFVGDMIVVVVPRVRKSTVPRGLVEKCGKHAAAIATLHIAIRTVGRMLGRASSAGVFLRGAIAYGQCLVKLGDDLVCLGFPLKEAATWEGLQNWSGAILAPSAHRILRPWMDGLTRRRNLRPSYVLCDVPFKSTVDPVSAPDIAVNWPAHFGLDFSATAPNLSQFEGKPPDVIEKMRNTKRFHERWSPLVRRK